eukprot:CAMPEP_0197321234 /NCGR_PEP_ID=MMETSP0891-20130614/64040_1 /TAXON_ID=44058 ORGANISM="Aureoumbra lagunensis, Strain CCMP1510" /NCGR_SAMPLE_ID=MMETSP0891 /ASSEMBLY_ACC=CAM_ASM_000534 /LENGTH=239 /DNA_ID=CAMNT_0042813011 /DNA_START=29 /DNA_END=748 /DNA_ORIENTATION=+
MPPKKAVKKSHGLTVKFVGVETKDEGEKKYNVYNLEVSKEGETWEVQKRYSEFLYFYTHLDKKVYGKMVAEFPPKSLGQLTLEQMDQRQTKLKDWFDEFLTMPITPKVLQQVYSFLQVRKHIKDETVNDGLRKFPGAIIKTGYLNKLGGNKGGGTGNWKRRFMVLSDNLLYYENEEAYENGAAPKGKVSLNAIYCPTPNENNPENEFVIYAIPYEFIVRAESKQEMDEWLSIFQKLQAV